MKKAWLYLLIIGLFFQPLKAQEPDSNLFRQWYLTNITIDDVVYNASEYYPFLSIFIQVESPTLYTFSIPYVDGTCSFIITSFDENPNSFALPLEIDTCLLEANCLDDPVTGPCSFLHNKHAEIYTNRPSSFIYEVSQNSNNTFSLEINNTEGNTATYSSVLLSNDGFTSQNSTITPNPVSSTLYLNTQNLAIQSLYVFNLSGQKILEQSTNTKSLDVSSLQNGMYFLQIATEKGSVIKKFIKQ